MVKAGTLQPRPCRLAQLGISKEETHPSGNHVRPLRTLIVSSMSTKPMLAKRK